MISRFFSIAVLALALCAVAPAGTIHVGFDSVVAPCCFNQVTPGGPLGPQLTYNFLKLDGGVILNGPTGWANLQTSNPNVYGTSDFLPLQDSSLLPGVITGVFDIGVDTLGFDIINGFGTATFTVKVYNASNALIGSASFPLFQFPGPGAVGSVFFNLPGQIKWFEVTSSQLSGAKVFAIDSLYYSSDKVPEPTTFALMGLGLVGLAAVRKYRK